MVDFEEDCHACDVVNHRVVLSPFSRSCPYYRVASLLRAVLQVVWPDYLGNFLVGQEFPDTVTCYYNKFVFGLKLKPHYFRVTTDSNRMSYEVAKGPTHRKSWSILVLKPHTLRAQVLAHTSLDSVDSSTNLKDSLLFHRHARLVILA